MCEEVPVHNNHREAAGDQDSVVDIYPLSSYLAHGLRTCVEAVILVELFKHPHVLVLQVKNSIFKLPGGRLRPGESDIGGLKRKLARKLSANEDQTDWEVGECLGKWWKPDFETLLYPYLPPTVKKPKECTKVFLVRLPVSCKFIVPKNLKLLAVPLCQLYENPKTYGQVISGVPQLLSKFSFNIINF
ncbi:pre-mRNA cleavage factor Im 25 kDa subunit 1 isoform X3 [Mercurialis annua]|uniref:pre-mRNA cleavage factor Im 25 kDa subunit 1 isoform X3 n=1 Tax=Mercurialis annua TaxID=3986 RepID=UPI00216049EA|nr:pre-mRNA cleavage factor Im 25 kDa subunit 1 isoform X3 [Mercurialis annua]